MEYAVALIVLVALVALVVLVPLRRGGEDELRERGRIEELRAAKEAKYREIRDAELDHGMGKLSREDWRVVDRELRGEAIEILRELDRLEGREPELPREPAREPDEERRPDTAANTGERRATDDDGSADADRSGRKDRSEA